LCFIHWSNSGPILCFIHWTNSVLYTLNQFWTNSVLYTLGTNSGPIVLYTLDQLWTNSVPYNWTNSKALLVLTQGFPDEVTPGVPKHDTFRKETVYRLVHEQLVWHAECEIMHGHTILQLKYHLPTKPVPLYTRTHTHTHTQSHVNAQLNYQTHWLLVLYNVLHLGF
jgi:hypothetical protein